MLAAVEYGSGVPTLRSVAFKSQVLRDLFMKFCILNAFYELH